MLIGSLAEIIARVGADGAGTVSVAGQPGALTAEECREWARRFVEEGLVHGDRVVLFVDHDLASVAALVAAWALGLVVVPLKAGGSGEAADAVAADCGARLIAGPASGLWSPLPRSRKAGGRLRFLYPRGVSGTDLALIVYTSGSTSRPKGIMLTHANVIAALQAISHYLQLDATHRRLCQSPLSFDYGLYQLLFAFHTGCHTVLAAGGFEPLRCIDTIRREAITVLPVVPALATALARTLVALRRELPGVRLITNTGGHLPEATIAMLERVCPAARIVPMYGLSECKRALFLPPEERAGRPGSVGRPMPGLQAAVMRREDGRDGVLFAEVPHGDTGELFVRGPSLMQGYCSGAGGAELIAGDYRDDNWLATGDLFMRDEDGFFYFRGRAKELIKQGGFCLYPRDIEETVSKHPDVAAALVVG
jgi:acyl-CoA synthetase (AMP-forming)/AMP-acid ligase II